MLKLLDDLKNFLDFLPGGFLDAPDINLDAENLSEDDRKKVIEFAKSAYPYVFGYKKVFDDCCRLKEEVGIHNFIKDEGVRARFDKFIREGGDTEDIRQGKIQEEYLSEDDLMEFEKAERNVHEEVHEEVQKRIEGQDKEKFEEFVKQGKEKVEEINEKIRALREMGGEMPEYSEEIDEKIIELEDRWVSYDNEPQSEDLNELLEYYNSLQM